MFGTVKSQSDNSVFPIDYRALNRGIFKSMFIFHRIGSPSKAYDAHQGKLTSDDFIFVNTNKVYGTIHLILSIYALEFDEQHKVRTIFVRA